MASTSSSDAHAYGSLQDQIETTEDLLSIWSKDWKERTETEQTRVKNVLSVNQRISNMEKIKDTPHLSNISNDPMISGRVIHFLLPGKTQVGAATGTIATDLINGRTTSGLDQSIQLMGLSVDASHCAVTNDGSGSLTLINMSQHTCVSGDPLHPSDQHALKDGDWVVFGKTFDRHV